MRLSRTLLATATTALWIAFLSGCSTLTGLLSNSGGDTSIADVVVGQCMNVGNLRSDDPISTVEIIDCAEPHDAESYWKVDFSDYSDFPGSVALDQLTNEQCVTYFRGFVGIGFDLSTSYGIYYYRVTLDGWKEGDRTAICLVVDVNNFNASVSKNIQLVGSAQGTAK